MQYTGMPMGMGIVFAHSFRKQLIDVFEYDANTAEEITKLDSQNAGYAR